MRYLDNAKVDERVWVTHLGWCKIASFDFVSDYPIKLRPEDVSLRDSPYNMLTSNLDGKILSRGPQCVFYDEIKFSVPPPPKRKVKKYIRILAMSACQHIIVGDDTGHTRYYDTRSNAAGIEGEFITAEVEVEE